MSDFRILQVNYRPWSESDRDKYIADGYDGVSIRVSDSSRDVENIDFVRELPGLRFLKVEGNIADDSAAFDASDLEHLELSTRARGPLQLQRTPRLRQLVVGAREGIESVAELGALTRLEMWSWAGGSLAFLGDKPELAFVRLESAGQAVDPTGVERAPKLGELWITDGVVTGLRPLRGLTELRRIQIVGVADHPGGGRLDLGELTEAKSLEWLALTFQRSVRSVAPLLDLPSLRGVRLRGTPIEDRDLEPLVRLPAGVAISPLDAVPPAVLAEYKPSPAEVQRLRSTR
jgi:catechol 2,3-dioxygenase-like lactoylglutathione lyase family enzyme